MIELRKEMGVYKPPFDPPERFYDASYWAEATGLRGNEHRDMQLLNEGAQQHRGDDAQNDRPKKCREKVGDVKIPER